MTSNLNWTVAAAIAGLTAAALTGCERSEPAPGPTAAPTTTTAETTHGEHGDAERDHMGHDHDHGDEVSLGKTMVGDIEIECWQSHGELEPGKELHLVVKLPYNDNGATIIRAWLGTEDRLASMVGRGEYAASHDDYDLHAEAPDPLPENTRWWIEIEKPDGTKAVGSINAI